jgi:hypothetical protein
LPALRGGPVDAFVEIQERDAPAAEGKALIESSLVGQLFADLGS